MIRKILLLHVLSLIIWMNVSAQINTGNWKKTEEDKKECRKFSNNFYFSGGIIPFTGFYNYAYVGTKFDHNLNQFVETKNLRHAFSIGFEANVRYNILNYRDFFSISASVFPELVSAADFLGGNGGGTIVNLPIGIDLNFFNHSTFNNVNNFGFSLSGGIQSHNYSRKDNTIGPMKLKWNDTFTRLTFKYRKYKNSFTEKAKKNKYYYSYLGLQYSFSKEKLVINGLTEMEKFSSFKIVIGKIFGY